MSEIEPKHQRDNKVDVFINLYATQEDHGDVRVLDEILFYLFTIHFSRLEIKRIQQCKLADNEVPCRLFVNSMSIQRDC